MGSTLQTWIEIGLIATVFVVLLTSSVIVPMNNRFNQTYDIGLSGNISEYQTLQGEMQEKVDQGKATFLGSLGMSLSTSWDLIKLTFTTVLSFISGMWIPKVVVEYLHLPALLGIALQILYFVAIVAIIASIVFRRDRT